MASGLWILLTLTFNSDFFAFKVYKIRLIGVGERLCKLRLLMYNSDIFVLKVYKFEL